MGEEAYEVIVSRLPKLVEKIPPEEISDDLLSLKIINEEQWQASFDVRELRKKRTRALIYAVMQAVKKDAKNFEGFCTVLKNSDKKATQDWGDRLREDLQVRLERIQTEKDSSSPEVSTPMTHLKEELLILRKSILRSDENLDAKHNLIKEFITRFIKNSIETEVAESEIEAFLKLLCYEEALVPSKLHEWCFNEFVKFCSKLKVPELDIPSLETETPATKPLFSKDNVYHAMLLCNMVYSTDVRKYESFLSHHPHLLEEVCMSENPSKDQDDEGVERYTIARKDKVIFVAFCGEPILQEWQDKYSTFNEGICAQANHVPIRFFVERIREGHQIIFTGFSFGALLAMSVHSALWNQTCLDISDLKSSVACISFSPPMVAIDVVSQTLSECSDMKSNTHIVYLKTDILPRLLQCCEFGKPREGSVSSGSRKLYATTIGGEVINLLSKLQKLHIQTEKTTEESHTCLLSLKAVLKDAIPMVPIEVKAMGTIYLIYSDRGVHVMSELANEAVNDHLQFPNAIIIDKIHGDIIKQHSIKRYDALLFESLYDSEENGGRYTRPKKALTLPQKFPSLKPSVSSVTVSHHGEEVALILEGENLWFCHKIKIGNRAGARIIRATGPDVTKRSINFNYIPQHSGDLLIAPRDTTVSVTLYSHFSKPITKRGVEARKKGDYSISFRQQQLAKLTPTEVIRLSFLSAMLERPSSKYVSSGRPSRRYKTICNFLVNAVRIVPVESIFHAIENETDENVWKCAEALIDSGFMPTPSFLLLSSLKLADIRLTTGFRPDILERVAGQAMSRVYDNTSPVMTHYQVCEKEVFVTVQKGRIASSKKYVKGGVELEDKIVFEPLSFSDAVKGTKKPTQHTIAVPKDRSQFHSYSNKSTLIIHKIKEMRAQITRLCEIQDSRKQLKVICGLNIEELYPAKVTSDKTSCLEPPITVLMNARKKFTNLQDKAEKEIHSLLTEGEDSINHIKALHNEEMIGTVNDVFSHDLAICLSLLGAFMERQMKIPLVNSPQETAHLLQTTKSSPAVGVWALFCLDMIDLQSIIKSQRGQALIVEVERYIQGILNQREVRDNSPDRGKYAGKLQFLIQGMSHFVSCNTKYISYSLERQLYQLCYQHKIKPDTCVSELEKNWDKTFDNNLLYHVMGPFRPLLARWLIWSLNIHHLREELASHTTVGVVGLSNSGKSCLVSKLFKQKAITGTTSMQRTTVPFLYNLEGFVDGLSIADFPGVDDNDDNVVGLSSLLLQLSQLVILVIDYRRHTTLSAKLWLDDLDNSGVPVLVCLTHADKFYANECLREHGKDCPNEIARRIIGKELERIKERIGNSPRRTIRFYSFSQDSDSFLNCDEGRETMGKVGVYSQKDVGDWLEEELRQRIKQPDIADKLHKFVESDDPVLPSSSTEVDESISEQSITNTFPLPVPSELRAVDVCGETTFKVTGDGQSIDWLGYGLKMDIPPGALPADDNCTIAIKAITSGQFSIPHHSEVVSSYYWIYSPRKFLKPVDVQLQHCARLSSDEDCSQMQFIIARCDQKELPYKFSIKNGVFSPNNRQGLISLPNFSIIAIIRNAFSFSLLEPPDDIPRPLNNCYYVFKVFSRKLSSQNTWQFDIIITKDIEPYLKAIDSKYCSDSSSWIEDIPPASIEFQEETILISPPLEELHPDWKYVSKYSQNIKKSYVDRCQEKTTQQCCRIAFRWMGNGEPLPMECTVQLQGAVDTPKLTLMLPIDNPINESTHSNTPTKPDASAKHSTGQHSLDQKEITSEPTIPELLNEVAGQAPDKWRVIGIGLGIDISILNSIEQQYNRNPNECYLAMFDKWLKTAEKPMWETILKVLETPSVDRYTLAMTIRKNHS